MQHIELSRSFQKAYKRRIRGNKNLEAKYKVTVELFMSGQRGYPLNDHALKGLLVGRRAFSVSSDIRVIYVEVSGRIVFLDIGTHNQVYR